MSKSIPFRTAYGSYKSSDYSYSDSEPSLTHQSFQKECDINVIMARWQKTGDLSHVRHAQGRYDDFSDIGDYQSALNTVIAAQESFEALPAAVRLRFGNNPADFVNFMQNPANSDEIYALGLAERPVLSESFSERSSDQGQDDIALKTASKSISDP